MDRNHVIKVLESWGFVKVNGYTKEDYPLSYTIQGEDVLYIIKNERSNITYIGEYNSLYFRDIHNVYVKVPYTEQTLADLLVLL